MAMKLHSLEILALVEDNIAHAQVMPTSAPQENIIPLPDDFRQLPSEFRKKKQGMIYDHVCIECGLPFISSRATSKFCINKGCRNVHNVRKARKRRAEHPNLTQERQRQRNVAWSRYEHGLTDEPPKQVGRPTKFQQERKEQLSSDRALYLIQHNLLRPQGGKSPT